MRVLVTGANGFVGRHTVAACRARGLRVRALVRSQAKADSLEGPGVEAALGSLDDGASLASALDGIETVIHVAGLVAARSEEEFLRVNRDGAARLAAAARTAGCARFVLVSSLAASRPLTAYGRSKLAGEHAVRDTGVPLVVMRPPAVFGPWDVAFLGAFRAAQRGFAPVLGAGTQRLSFVYGPDLGEALATVAATPACAAGPWVPCHPRVVTSLELARSIGEAVGKNVRTVRLPGGLVRVALAANGFVARLAGRATILTADKARELLAPEWVGDPAPLTEACGWSAAHDLLPALRATAAWYRERGRLPA